jgi:hypothetical protein
MVEGLVPGNTGIASVVIVDFTPQHHSRGRPEAKIYKDAGEIGLREKYRVDRILASGHRHAQVGGRMMSPMKSPQPRNLVMQPVVPVLGKVIGDAENENTPEERDPAKDG